MLLGRMTCLVLASAAALSACASTAGGTRPGACRSALAQDPRPLGAVADSAVLHDVVEGFWTSDAGLTLASIAYDSTGALDTVRVYATAPRLPVPEVEQRVRSAALPTADTVGSVWVVLGDETGPGVRRVAAVHMCGPEILNRSWVAKRLTEEASRLGLRESIGVQVSVLVLPDGEAREFTVTESSGNLEADHMAGVIAQAITWQPAMIEGIPVQAYVRFPMTFAVRRRQAPASTRTSSSGRRGDRGMGPA